MEGDVESKEPVNSEIQLAVASGDGEVANSDMPFGFEPNEPPPKKPLTKAEIAVLNKKAKFEAMAQLKAMTEERKREEAAMSPDEKKAKVDAIAHMKANQKEREAQRRSLSPSEKKAKTASEKQAKIEAMAQLKAMKQAQK